MHQPLLVLWGSEDRLVPPQISQRLSAHKPDLELQLLPQLGHCPHDEHPSLFNARVLHWLQRTWLQRSSDPRAPADA
jgi:pimeloyl-ACP methyl ester carboxylesterase